MENLTIDLFFPLNVLFALVLFVTGTFIIRLALTMMEFVDIKFYNKRFKEISILYISLVTLLFLGVHALVQGTTYSMEFFFCYGILAYSLEASLRAFFKNLAAAITLYIFKTFKTGDFVKIGSTIGEVESYNSMYTIIKLEHGEFLMLPNTSLIECTITNYTDKNLKRMVINIEVENRLNFDKMKSILMERIADLPFSLKNPRPEIHLTYDSDNEEILSLHSWLKSGNYEEARELHVKFIKMALENSGIPSEFNGREFEIIKN